MAQSQNTLIGRMKKSLGNLTALTLKGKNILKSKAIQVKQPGSPSQIQWKNYFTSVVWFVKNSKSLIELGFANASGNMPSFAKAISFNLNLPPKMINFMPFLDFDLAQISRGPLEGFLINSIWIDAPATLNLEWLDNSNSYGSLGTDVLKIYIVNQSRDKSIISPVLFHRSDLSAQIDLSIFSPGENIFGFLFFYQPETGIVSDTFNTHVLEIPGE